MLPGIWTHNLPIICTMFYLLSCGSSVNIVLNRALTCPQNNNSIMQSENSRQIPSHTGSKQDTAFYSYFSIKGWVQTPTFTFPKTFNCMTTLTCSFCTIKNWPKKWMFIVCTRGWLQAATTVFTVKVFFNSWLFYLEQSSPIPVLEGQFFG